MKRLFAAIKINPTQTFHEVYYQLKQTLKSERIKWVELENMHITLKFFGETPEHKIPEINGVLNALAQQFQTLNLSLKNVGVFGSSYKPRVIWIGIEQNPGLHALGMKVLNELELIGFSRDRQNFVPHLTLGRIQYIENKKRFNDAIQQLNQTAIQRCEIEEMHLYESILKPAGPTYLIVNTFSFKKKPA